MVDLVGLELEEARARAQASGCIVRTVTETRPSQSAELAGPLRVIRARVHDGAFDLVVTRERYIPRGA